MRRTKVLGTVLGVTASLSVCSCCVLNGRGALSSLGLTKLGYFPATIAKYDELDYEDVRKWAEAVADGYDSRATLNRYSVYLTAFIGAAAAGSMAGLGAFSADSPAITGIPIGTAFLGSLGAYYQNEDRAHVYEVGAQAIAHLVTLADRRMVELGSTPAPECAVPDEPCPSLPSPNALKLEGAATTDRPQSPAPTTSALKICTTSECIATCLETDVQIVIDAVKSQLREVDPANVGKDLKALAKTSSQIDGAASKDLVKAATTKLVEDYLAKTVSMGELSPPRTTCAFPEGYPGPVVPYTSTTTSTSTSTSVSTSTSTSTNTTTPPPAANH